MTYQGSKAKYSKFIAPILQKCINENNIHTFIDCFCGGCNIITDIKCDQRLAFDNNPYLIAFWRYLRENPDYEFPPYPSREEWDKCKSGEENRDWYIGLVSIFCSNMTGGFPAGYDKMGLRYNGRIKNCRKDLPFLKDVSFLCYDYHHVIGYKNAVIYMDPPYEGGHQYNYEKFDSKEFWNFARELSQNNYVFTSEQNAPEDFTPIWSLEIKHNIRGNTRIATENLFVYDNGMAKEYIQIAR